jgi:hypothetical protein
LRASAAVRIETGNFLERTALEARSTLGVPNEIAAASFVGVGTEEGHAVGGMVEGFLSWVRNHLGYFRWIIWCKSGEASPNCVATSSSRAS